MARFPYGGFGDGQHEKDPPWTKLATIQEHLEDGEQVPPELARWLGEAIKGAKGNPVRLLAGLDLGKVGRPNARYHPEAPAAFLRLWELINGPFLAERGKDPIKTLSVEEAMKTVQDEFTDANGVEIFKRSTLQRWLAPVRLAEDEARASRED